MTEASPAEVTHPAITLAAGAIHRPDEPRHFMSVTPVAGPVNILLGETVAAETDDAMRLLEVGYRMYPPVLYLPSRSVGLSLERSATTSHCPLKGDCALYSLDRDGEADIAWSYEDPFDFAAPIAGLIAFDPARVTTHEGPAR